MKIESTSQDSGWNISFWFAVSSPLLGVLAGFLGSSDFLPVIEQAMSITVIVFVLIILLFGFNPTEDLKTRRKQSHDQARFAEGVQ